VHRRAANSAAGKQRSPACHEIAHGQDRVGAR